MNHDYCYVAMCDGTPILVAHTIEEIQSLLDDYNGVPNKLSERIKYKSYDSYFPSINDLEGTYTYKDTLTGDIDEFKVYGVKYKNNGNNKGN